MSGEIEIRDFRRDDQAAVKSLILAGLRDHWGTLDPRFNRDLDDIGSYEDAGGRTLVAVDAADGGRVVGTGTLVRRDLSTAEILRMSVDSSARRGGLGRTLVRALVTTARDWGCERVVLETSTGWSGVIAFYLRCGFEVTHRSDGAFGEDTWFEMRL